MTLDEMTILVADVEVMDIVNNTLKHNQPKITPGNGKKPKEDAGFPIGNGGNGGKES